MAAENDTGIDLSSSPITWDDATWILTSAFIIFTMQSGFGLLEAGNVSGKNEVNIMVKNVVDVVFGGLTYWMFGFGLSFGMADGTNPFCGFGFFFVDVDSENMGIVYSTFVFQLSFATTATTIVSGAMAERTKLTSYIVFSLVNTIVYCIPAHWAWATNGFLSQLGCIDFAGSGVVHMVGGVSGLIATLLLGPRINRFEKDAQKPPMANPANAIVGMFMLWWGWLAFNCGSTFGISRGKWKLAAKTAVTTLLSSMSGGVMAIGVSYFFQNKNFDISYMVNGILGSLVSITASCPIIHPWESLVIGALGALFTVGCDQLLNRLHVDDPVAAVAVHGASGAWGLLAVGLFASEDPVENLTNGRNGLFHGGGFYLLGVQLLAILCEAVWSGLTTFGLLYLINKTIGLRMSEEEERFGADLVEHCVTKANTDSHLVFSGQSTSGSTISHLRLNLDSWAQPSGDNNGERSSKTNGNVEFSRRSNGILSLTSLNSQGRNGHGNGAGTRPTSSYAQDDIQSNNTTTHRYDNHSSEEGSRSTVGLYRARSNSLRGRKVGDIRCSSSASTGSGTVDPMATSRVSNGRRFINGGTLQRMGQNRLAVTPQSREGSVAMQPTGTSGHDEEIANFSHIAQVYPA